MAAINISGEGPNAARREQDKLIAFGNNINANLQVCYEFDFIDTSAYVRSLGSGVTAPVQQKHISSCYSFSGSGIAFTGTYALSQGGVLSQLQLRDDNFLNGYGSIDNITHTITGDITPIMEQPVVTPTPNYNPTTDSNQAPVIQSVSTTKYNPETDKVEIVPAKEVQIISGGNIYTTLVSLDTPTLGVVVGNTRINMPAEQANTLVKLGLASDPIDTTVIKVTDIPKPLGTQPATTTTTTTTESPGNQQVPSTSPISPQPTSPQPSFNLPSGNNLFLIVGLALGIGFLASLASESRSAKKEAEKIISKEITV